ncbi:hypothetical protein KY290_038318 [Solanum tuberosum]|uniref:GAG-pre-integrase domain-containing protein n=1 Tax=Solanum tuberosum TaxID=4113 RepID=A0ABQ7TZL6_SOLTU|nr:hypothetical protein KY289_036041 [Solanum tuberosum]KAH0639280.1 hypothetical protein KY285_035866 [Solanum tuberosum]KAH0739613.1 hypothetical protein KY290_038318 [Solanum tuberosum]
MACIDTDHKPSDVWFVNSGCSNHMTSNKSLFQELDEKQNKKVQLGNAKEMQVEGKGTVGINTSHDKVKMLDNVQFVPDLGYNLLSVGQLMSDGHSLWFDDDACVITNKKSGKKIRITMTPNKMFPLEVSNMEIFALAASAKDESKLWHLRYGHLNIKGLKLLVDKGCIYGKQTRKSFPVGKAWRASNRMSWV